MKQSIKVGSRVKMSAAWLHSVGCYVAEIAHLIGTVTALSTVPYSGITKARVRWDDGMETSVLARNLVDAGQPDYSGL